MIGWVKTVEHAHKLLYKWMKNKARENFAILTLFSFNVSQICFLVRPNHRHVLGQAVTQSDERIGLKHSSMMLQRTAQHWQQLGDRVHDSRARGSKCFYSKSNPSFLACAVNCALKDSPSLIFEIKFPLWLIMQRSWLQCTYTKK